MVTSRTAAEPEGEEDDAEETEITEKTGAVARSEGSEGAADAGVKPDGQINDV